MDEELSYRSCSRWDDTARWPCRQTLPTDKGNVAKRMIKAAAPAKVRRPPEAKTAWATESHSGEGAASALKTMQRMEEHRDAGRPAELPAENPDH
jgi:hypothetical protein